MQIPFLDLKTPHLEMEEELVGVIRNCLRTAAFVGALSGEVVVLYCFQFTSIAWLWYNVIGCFVVVGVGILLSMFERRKFSGSLASS